MNDRQAERQRILELLHEGKITVEQADLLLQALEDDRSARSPVQRLTDRIPMDELKQMGTHLTQTVTQAFSELRRTLEKSSWETLSFPFHFGPTVSVTTDLDLPASVHTLSVHTVHGRVQLSAWDEPHTRVHIRARVKTDSLAQARRTLEGALQVTQSEQECQVMVEHEPKEGVVEASIDVYLPRTMRKVFATTNQGGLHADGVEVTDELRLETDNGSIWLTGVDAARLRVIADNGHVQAHDSIGPRCKNAYLHTKNGKITVDGVHPAAHISGTAKTTIGRVEIEGDGWTVDPETKRQTFARFERPGTGDEQRTAEPVRLHCETRAGSVLIRS